MNQVIKWYISRTSPQLGLNLAKNGLKLMFVVKIVGAHVAKLSVGARSPHFSLVFDGQLLGSKGG